MRYKLRWSDNPKKISDFHVLEEMMLSSWKLAFEKLSIVNRCYAGQSQLTIREKNIIVGILLEPSQIPSSPWGINDSTYYWMPDYLFIGCVNAEQKYPV